MKALACWVVSVRLTPGVSMRSVAVAITCGVTSVMEKRPTICDARNQLLRIMSF